MKAASGGQRDTFRPDKPTEDGVTLTATTHISKRTMPPLLRLDSTGEVSSVSFGPVERMGQHKVDGNRCHSVNKALISTTNFFNNIVARVTPMSARSAAPLTHGRHLSNASRNHGNEMYSFPSKGVCSVPSMAVLETPRVAKISPPLSKANRYRLWGSVCEPYPWMQPGVFPCHIFSAMQSQKSGVNSLSDWCSPLNPSTGITGSVSDSALDGFHRINSGKREPVSPQQSLKPTETNGHGGCDVPVNTSLHAAESGAAMAETCDESTPSAHAVNKASDISSCASSSGSTSSEVMVEQTTSRTELTGASVAGSEEDISEEEKDKTAKNDDGGEDDDIIFEDCVDGAALPSWGDSDTDDDSSDWDDEDDDIVEDKYETKDSCPFGLAFKSLASFLPGYKKCNSENQRANTTWLNYYGPGQLPAQRSTAKVTFSCGKGVDQEIWYDREAEEVQTPTFMELALEKKDGTQKRNFRKHCSS